MTDNGPFDLSKDPIHLGDTGVAQGQSVALKNFGFDGPAFGAYIGEHCDDGAPGRLMMIETTPVDWTTWERHTDADEIVFVLEGKGEFIQEIDGREERIAVGPGQGLINPRGVWHTADVEESITAIYLTPCPGTENKPRG